VRGLAGAGLAALVAPACDLAPAPPQLVLVSFVQEGGSAVALNEDLQFYFSEELDRSSVTSGSLRVLDTAGDEVPGERRVRGKALTFSPDLPRDRDLSGGALRPGSTYTVVLGGFPRLDGLRARGGAVLSATRRFTFRTASRDGTGPLFLDAYPTPGPLVPQGSLGADVVLRDGRLVLVCPSPLDPSTIEPDDFTLHRIDVTGEPSRIGLAVELAQNTRAGAELWLEPLDSPTLEPADHYLLRMPGRHLRTLGGRPVEPGWPYLPVRVPDPLDFHIELGGVSEPPGLVSVPDDCDGTAYWDTTGMGVRFPSAAGLGEDGGVALTGAPARSDLRATRLLVPPGSRVDLSERRGPVVLRAQSSIEVRGALVRRADYGERESASDPVSQLMREAASGASARVPQVGDPPGDLDGWLEWLLQPGQPWSEKPWTVLVAGGDILVPRGGTVDVDGPLVLVAGGWIRVRGSLGGFELWKTPESLGNLYGRPHELPLEIPAPATNPLREDLRYGLLSGWMRLPPGPAAWRTVIERNGVGEVEVGFLVRRQFGGTTHEMRVRDPGRIGASDFQVLLELRVPAGPGEPWNPPHVSRLLLEPVR
jgi:hypothetical protein